jgi:hypothetical protein
MTRVVISQSMYFPWVGMLEQVRLADVFVHLDDVQFSKGSFVNRVQVRVGGESRWMTVPLRELHLGQRIDEVGIKPPAEWRDRHLQLLRESFAGAPFAGEALAVAEAVLRRAGDRVGPLARDSLMELVRYFGLDEGTRFVDATELGPAARDGSERVLGIVKALGGSTYVTGHGAARYLRHEEFERAGVRVEYMDYRCVPYPQPGPGFSPYVTGLDLLARCGRAGIHYIASGTTHWRDFVDGTQ